MAGFLARHAPLVLLLTAYAAIATVVLPSAGEAPAFDDWDYAFTTRVLADTGELRQSDMPAMTLVLHVAWGALFLRLLGDSWLALRVSMIVMSWIGGLSLYSIWRMQGRGAGQATIACGAFVFCPLVFCLSYTFMTDVTGTSLPLLFLACATAVVHRPRPPRGADATSDARETEPVGGGAWSYVGLGVLGALCYLTRQTAVIPAMAFGAMYGLGCALRRPGMRWSNLVAFLIGGLLPLGAFLCTAGRSAAAGQNVSRVLFDMELLRNVKGLIAKALSLLLETAALLFPLSLPMLFRPRGATDSIHWGRWLCLAAFLGAIVFVSPAIRPYRDFEVFDAGIRAPTSVIAWDHTRASPQVDFGGRSFSLFQLGMLACGAVSGWVLTSRCVEWWTSRNLEDPSRRLMLSVALLSLLGYGLLLLVVEWVFDRYLILAIGLAIAGLAFLPADVGRRSEQCVAAACLALNALFAVVLTQESMAVNSSAWQAYRTLIEEGVPPHEIDAGLPGWYGHFWAPGRDKRAPAQQYFDSMAPRPADGPDGDFRWRIAARTVPGWEVARTIATDAWFREKQLLILRKLDGPEASSSVP